MSRDEAAKNWDMRADDGELLEDDKEEIYQEMLFYIQDNLDEAQMIKFLNKVNETLKMKRDYEIGIEESQV